MKSVGEAMGIGRTFTEAFAKAMRSREIDDGWRPRNLHPWFQAELDRLESALAGLRSLDDLVADDFLRLKRLGLSDAEIAAACGADRGRRARKAPLLRCAPRLQARRLLRRRGRGGLLVLLLDLGRGRGGSRRPARSRGC